ncbi:hypothetical protein QA601_09355 [Chitinispirillales bacterium ANBcel5]|uniref:hypothetical protein n=1 Tax=Cellulosispirillum alkaliphilum TaxID=3039283 RepID=UPI002A4FD27B|nr:hypothetical protein [Chitinispirillales bacterium ANBcel5]
MKYISELLLAMLFFTGFFSPVYSYIDMGTGSYVLQIILASFFGVLYAVKIYWKKILLVLRKPKRQRVRSEFQND